MNEILFSIVIPHYNIPDSLVKLLDSIPDESDLEVIVVDDKSNEKLEELNECIKQYEGPNRHFYFNDTAQKGAGICRNIGMGHALGKWLLFADADDYFTEDFYKIISSCSDRDEDIVFFFPTSINVLNGKESDRHVGFCSALNNYIENPSEKNELVLRYQVVSPWSKLIKKKLIDDNNISFEGTRVANDVMFCRMIGFYAEKISVEDRVIYVVSDRDGSLTKLMDKKSYFDRLDVFVRSTRFVRDKAGKQVLKKMNFNGSYFLHLCWKNKLGFLSIIKTLFVLLNNGISPI